MGHFIVLAFGLPFVLGMLATILIYAFYCVIKTIIEKIKK